MTRIVETTRIDIRKITVAGRGLMVNEFGDEKPAPLPNPRPNLAFRLPEAGPA